MNIQVNTYKYPWRPLAGAVLNTTVLVPLVRNSGTGTRYYSINMNSYVHAGTGWDRDFAIDVVHNCRQQCIRLTDVQLGIGDLDSSLID
jgi:hypothetical protein